MSPHLRIYLLGEFRLLYDDVPLTTVSTPRLQSLLAYLLLHRHAAQARSQVAFALWPDLPEARARANLRRQLHQLQQELPNADRFLIAGTQTLQWLSDSSIMLDVAEFEQAANCAQSNIELQHTLDLYRGDLLPGCYDDWLAAERERLKQLHVEVLERLLQLATTDGDYTTALKHAHHLLQIDPLREEIHRQVMNLQALMGDRAAALRAYHVCASILQRELEVEPGPATREIYERLLNLEITTAAPLDATFPLIGREREWTQLHSAWRTASAGHAQFALLIGEAGMGKTRLADELFTRVKRQGLNAAVAHCYAAEGTLAYAPIVAWLRARPLVNLEAVWLTEIARLLPEVLIQYTALPAPGALTENWQRQRLHEALARAVLGNHESVLLWLEDVQWCDRDTLEWLHYLLRFDRTARVLIVGTLRPEEARSDHPIAPLLAALRRDRQLIEIAVGPLDPIGTRQLAAHVAGSDLDAARLDCLYQETEGNPLFIIETLRAEAACADSDALPPTVQAVITTRLAQLSPQAQALMELAATIGREFTFEILRQADGADERALVRALDELWQRRIIREVGTSAYDFSHGKLREAAYAALSSARKRLLHRSVAEALIAVHADEADTSSAQIAAHYQQAGLTEQAATYYRQAAQTARRVYAHQDAVTYLSRALDLLPTIKRIERFDVLLERESIYALQGVREAQARDLATLLDWSAQLDDPIKQAQVAIEQGNYWRDVSNYAAAITSAQQALRRIEQARQTGSKAASLEIEAHYLWGTTLDFQGQYEAACRQHTEALTLARANHLRHDEARCLYGLSRAAADASAGEAYLEASLAIHREVGDQPGESLCLDQLGYHRSVRGDYEVAAAYYEQSLRLAKQIGFRPCETNVLFRLGLLHNQFGDYAHSQPYLEQAIAMARQDNDLRSVAQGLYNLSWTERGLRRCVTARSYAQEALKICQSIGDRNGEAAALKNLGEALLTLEEAAEAATTFQQLLEVCRRLADQAGTLDAWAGLAASWLAQGDSTSALACIEEILREQATEGTWLDPYVDVFPVYAVCYRVLQANRDPRADRILVTAYALLQDRALRLTSESLRRSFLESVAAHREIVQAWQAR